LEFKLENGNKQIMIMSQTLKEAILAFPQLIQVRGGKTDNRCYVTLNAAIHKVISELHKLDTKMPTPIEFVQQVTIQEQQY
jgi:SUMO ligase MMS21 Smc5/6 complex component